MTATPGAIRAANRIADWFHLSTRVDCAKIIDEETHAAEVKALLEWIEVWDFDIQGDCVSEASRAAHDLLAKMKG